MHSDLFGLVIFYVLISGNCEQIVHDQDSSTSSGNSRIEQAIKPGDNSQLGLPAVKPDPQQSGSSYRVDTGWPSKPAGPVYIRWAARGNRGAGRATGYPSSGEPNGPSAACCGGYGQTELCSDTTDPCFLAYPNCIIVNAQPYERRSQMTLDACKANCRNSIGGSYQCRSIVYDRINQICDLFAHTGNQSPAKLTRYSGREYFQLIGNNCTGAQGQGPSSSQGALCTSGQKAVYVQVSGYRNSAGANTIQITAQNIQTCMDACSKGQTQDGKSITCKSFDFNDGQCTFYPTLVPAAAQAAGLEASWNSIHVDQVCVDSSQTCTGTVERDPQRLLVGFAELVTDAREFTECLQKCMNSQTNLGFECKSGLFYYKESSNNCILNSESKLSHPELYSKENQDTLDYFEVNCVSSGSVGRRPPLVGGLLNKKSISPSNSDEPDSLSKDGRSSAPLGEWTEWSPCDRRKDGRRIRYRVCGVSLKQCPFETEWCNSSTDLESRKSQSSSPLFGLTTFTLRNITQTRHSSSDTTCPADTCCAVFGGCRIGLLRSSTTGQLGWCTDPCRERALN